MSRPGAAPPAALFVKMNDRVVRRNGVSASRAGLGGPGLSGWDSTPWRLPYWCKHA